MNSDGRLSIVFQQCWLRENVEPDGCGSTGADSGSYVLGQARGLVALRKGGERQADDDSDNRANDHQLD